MSKPKKEEVAAGSLDELQGLCARPLPIEFKYADKPFRIETRHLTPREAEIVKIHLEEAIPPLIKGKNEEGDRFDYVNPDYLKKKTRVEREGRALAIFWATKAFRDKLPEISEEVMYRPEARPRIFEFVNSMLTDELLEVIYQAILSNEISTAQQVNFTSPAG